MKNIFRNLILIAAVAILSTSAFAQGSLKTVAKLSDLKLLQPDPNFPNAFVAGWTTAGDGGWGIYRWNASSALSTNYSIVASTSDSGSAGQWIRALGGGTKSPATQTLAASTAIKAEASTVKVVGTSGATTLTVNPMIAANGLKDGQELTIEGTSDTDTVVLTDNGTDSGSLLELGASTRTLGIGDVLKLKYDATDVKWYEIGFNNN